MAYSVNWATKVITIPKADTGLVSSSPDVRSLDVEDLWTNLIDIQDSEAGMNYPDIVLNTPPVSVAGITLARVVQVINGYTLTFEDGQYAVNVVGGNSNVADVTNKNQVSVNTSNSAGFIVGDGSGGSTLTAAQVWAHVVEDGKSAENLLRIALAALAGKVTGADGTVITIRSIGDTKDRIVATVDEDGNRTSVTLDGT